MVAGGQQQCGDHLRRGPHGEVHAATPVPEPAASNNVAAVLRVALDDQPDRRLQVGMVWRVAAEQQPPRAGPVRGLGQEHLGAKIQADRRG
ncbi:hypothetical protein [Dactylosporangium sp. NPDC051484]|uniref:hypothetical protein n=1 Tax=Dactylosporangium sp. NPDC051484 TaxID=3154942 RepID=UPI00344E4FAE